MRTRQNNIILRLFRRIRINFPKFAKQFSQKRGKNIPSKQEANLKFALNILLRKNKC